MPSFAIMAKSYFIAYTLLLYLTFVLNNVTAETGVKVIHFTPLQNNVEVKVEDAKDQFHIFCRMGDSKKVINYFKSATLRIVSAADDIRIISGPKQGDVYQRYQETTRFALWAQNLLPWRFREATFPTFNSSCIGIVTNQNYSARFISRRVDTWNALTLVAGISLFYYAAKLARSARFFYTTGTIIGGLGAALIFIFIVFKFMPRGRTSYVTLAGLWFLTIYAAGETWKRSNEILHENMPYILVYLTTGAAISFMTCYRIGPPSHPRTLDILTWIIQAGGLICIHLSSDFVELSTTLICIIVCYHYWVYWILIELQKWWRRRFPPKPKLLTEEEYIAQGAVETAKELQDLRKYCNSPECDSWKLVTRLQNPKRFSGFMGGESHLNDDEMMDYESDIETWTRSSGLPNGHGSLPITDDESE